MGGGGALTVLGVEQHLVELRVVVVKGLSDFVHHLLICQVTIHEAVKDSRTQWFIHSFGHSVLYCIYSVAPSILLAGAALVHDLRSVVSRELAETVIAVNHRPVDNLRVSQQEAGLWNKIQGKETPADDWRWSIINESCSSFTPTTTAGW